MKSLGVIETRGLVAAIQAVDAACKAAGVTCIGYRKVGSGLVSVCFEGEISAILTAIERGVEVAGTGQHVNSLVIARPEPSVVTALSNLKGRPPRPAASANLASPIADQAGSDLNVAAVTPTAPAKTEPTTPPASGESADKGTAMKKGKKA
ncbi:BMC domain-containing protein [Raoultella sp. BIGb0138]|uniref:BMC domain-containing protein n=1 Tax=Raoultella sp. BIGb0138 TaxID=2485115 RepID=UPI00104518B7|nr:BMC domain-containing protein [Raoultella sp. BIGb0138]TCW13009.1 BMC domain-containing protein [Raoultella sp. BIGb0138]